MVIWLTVPPSSINAEWRFCGSLCDMREPRFVAESGRLSDLLRYRTKAVIAVARERLDARRSRLLRRGKKGPAQPPYGRMGSRTDSPIVRAVIRSISPPLLFELRNGLLSTLGCGYSLPKIQLSGKRSSAHYPQK
jgi:hypothetical protein